MQQWRAENGPVDNEDLERHDKWLCMMWPRLHLLKELLADDGVIFVSIDDNEQHHLRMLMDEIFGGENFIETFIWRSRLGRGATSKNTATLHEYKDYIVLDSFAGSGTTAHAVLGLNKEDGGNRKFILVECEEYADTITAERVRRVINGVPDARDESLREGLGGSFTYCTLGKPIEIEGMLTGEALPPYESLAAHLLYTTSGVSVGASELEPKNADGLFHSDDKTNYYMLYKPDLDYL